METVEEDFKRSEFHNWKNEAANRIDGEASLGLSSLEPSCCTDMMMMMINVKYLFFLSEFNET
jgi:hypothetical protein